MCLLVFVGQPTTESHLRPQARDLEPRQLTVLAGSYLERLFQDRGYQLQSLVDEDWDCLWGDFCEYSGLWSWAIMLTFSFPHDSLGQCRYPSNIVVYCGSSDPLSPGALKPTDLDYHSSRSSKSFRWRCCSSIVLDSSGGKVSLSLSCGAVFCTS